MSSEAGSLTVQIKDSLIEKTAIVGEKRWEDLLVVFAGQGFRAFPVKFFESQEVAQARAWLAATARFAQMPLQDSQGPEAVLKRVPVILGERQDQV